MEKRQIKRLLILVALSIVIIMTLKKVLTEAAVSLNKVVAEKKPAPVQPQPTVLPTVDLPAAEPPAVQLEPVHFPPEPAEPPTEYVEMSPASTDSDADRIESKTADAPTSTNSNKAQ